MLLNKKSYFFYFLGFLFFITACISPSKKEKFPLTEKQVNQMDQALSLMKNKDFLKGAEIYDELALTLKDKSANTLMLFNAGVAYKEAGYCKKALIRFRKLLDQTLKQTPFKARGLIEISYVYECLGDTEMAFLSLKDAEKFLNSIPWMLNRFVYPARLAIAYAQLGKIPKAEHYKSLSLTRILQSKSTFSSEKELNEKMSRLLYLMGRSYVKKEYLKPEAFFKSFSYHQLYLLQSLFLKDRIWSEMSKKELDLLLDKLIFAVSNFKNKRKYKKLITQSIETARLLIEKEKNKKWEIFYSKKYKSILNLLDK